jgi:serine/threonine-protein kinase
MPLSVGDKLGPYEILAPIGAGGMGEVYRARDTTLKREVALKVLPEAFLRDPERMARFQREAEVLASLDHPNIGHIHGIVDSADSRGLVLALIEGPTLADRIEAGPIPLDEAVAIAKQVVEALEYAHDRGVVHRDLKPANVKINPDGVVKVLDFGLAKVLEDEPAVSSIANSPTLTVGHTRAGVILGTAAYMSPEQAVGRRVDRRSDIFSFGAVLYEMLTAKRAFAGEATPDVLEAVVKNDPDWSKLPVETPTAIRKLLQRCLIKDRKERLQAIGEARIVLRNPFEPDVVSAPSQSRFHIERWIAAAMTLITGVALWGWLKPAPSEPRLVTRFTIPLPADASSVYLPSISSDGTRLAFRSGNPARIYVRKMDELEAKPVPGTEGAVSASFSPDGQWIAFLAAGENGSVPQLKKIPVTGGAGLILVDSVGTTAPYLSWGSDDNILFTLGGALQRVPAGGGKPQILATPETKQGLSYAAPQLLPGGKEVLFTIGGQPNSAQVAVLNLQTGEKKILLEGANTARYAPSGPGSAAGYIVYERNGSLFAVPFDVTRLQVGTPAPVLEGVLAKGVTGGFALSDSGTLAYIPGSASAELPLSTLVWVDRQGVEQPLSAPPHPYGSPRISPDGQRVAVPIQTGAQFPPPGDVWLYELARGTLTRRTFEGTGASAVWTPDGKRLIYRANVIRSSEIRAVPADGSGPPVTLLTSSAPPYVPSSVSPDGNLLILQRPKAGAAAAEGGAVSVLSLPDGSSGNGKPESFLESQFTKNEVQFSPGPVGSPRWVAYQSNESGRNEIYVVPYPGPGGKSQISTDGGTTPRWASNGRELFYRNGDKVMAVEVQTGAAFSTGTPKTLFEKAGQYDVAPDGKRFLMVKAQAAAAQGQQNELQVVVNWLEELRRRAQFSK